ncbi:response regulator [Candidatus Peregrinibacteria bacterium]|nr:response regulator [Candidatus Peregrinibacteria bacterium]
MDNLKNDFILCLIDKDYMTRKSNPSVPDDAGRQTNDDLHDLGENKVESGFFFTDDKERPEAESHVSDIQKEVNSGLYLMGENEVLSYEELDSKRILADRKIFIADDDIMMLRTASRKFLANNSKIPVLAMNGMEAIDKVRGGDMYDVYLLDFEIPGVNGVQIAKEVKNVNPDGVVVIHSGFDFGNDEEKYGELLSLMKTGIVNRFIQKGKGNFIGAICEELVTRG